mmetsp:Transcript_17989/g.51062  ORF Transcript_17989/g.51062 Transcript_17989/m.51062 type:complete len:234 (-) Transcript_17989:425-1126(-)
MRILCAAAFTSSTRIELISTVTTEAAAGARTWVLSSSACSSSGRTSCCTMLCEISGSAHSLCMRTSSVASRKCRLFRKISFALPMELPCFRIALTKMSSKTFLDKRARMLMIFSTSMPVETAAFSDSIVSWYSCTSSGRLTGSATAIRKSVTSTARGWKLSKTMRPLGYTHNGRLAWSSTRRRSRRSSRSTKTSKPARSSALHVPPPQVARRAERCSKAAPETPAAPAASGGA